MSSGNFDFTRHAFKRSIERNISDSEIKEAGNNLKIIETYPDDRRWLAYLKNEKRCVILRTV